jgi:predicted alpha/beta-fold hydrolase
MALAGLGLGSWTAEQARRKVLTTMKAELSNLLPQVAQEQSFVVYQVVKECFETYQQDVVKRMNEDIAARKTELSDLIKQKEAREIDRDAEIQRLNQLDDLLLAQSHQVEDAYDKVLGIHLPEVETTMAEGISPQADTATVSASEESQPAMLSPAAV